MPRPHLLLALACLAAAPRALGLTPEEVKQVVKTVDERQRNAGDWKSVCYMEAKERDKTDVVYELTVYRRSADQKFMLLFDKPRSEQGKGYLRIEKNLWYYDPSVGRWDRRTERERIGGTDTRRGDLDESRLSEEYDAVWEGDGKLGAYQVHRLFLTVKPGVDVAFPQIRLWVDQATHNVLKRQELALSGKLMRTSLYPRWRKLYSSSKHGDVWFPEEMRFYDEIEKANQTLILVRSVDLHALDPNLFTKAWLEGRSR